MRAAAPMTAPATIPPIAPPDKPELSSRIIAGYTAGNPKLTSSDPLPCAIQASKHLPFLELLNSSETCIAHRKYFDQLSDAMIAAEYPRHSC